MWDTQSNASGAFTRYGDVTPLMQNADDMFVIGRQGDQVNMQFSTANLAPVAPGMVRDYFFVVACWFKDPPGAWGYGFNFTVDPMPFMAMSGFPYPTTESYPSRRSPLSIHPAIQHTSNPARHNLPFPFSINSLSETNKHFRRK